MPPRWTRALHPRRAAELARAWAVFRDPGALVRAYLRPGTATYPFRITTRAGQHLTLRDGHDVATAWVIFCRQEYEVPRGARCIVDIGANYGAFTLYATSRAPEARIVSVEPHPDEFPRLAETVRANGLADRVHLLQRAVAAVAGTRWIDADPAHPGPSRGLHAAAEPQPASAAPVTAVTLPALLDEALARTGADRIDLVKMDVEGAEHEFLPQLPPQTLARVNAWAMEYHPNGPSGPLFAALERAGLRLVHDVRAHRDSGVAHFRR